MLIDVNEYQTKILNIIGSDELDKIIASSVYADNHELRMAIIYGMTIASMYTAQCTQYTFDVTKSDASDMGGLNMKTHMVDIDTNTDVYDAIIHTSSHANISEEKDNTMTPKKWKEFKGYMHDLHEMQNECCGGCEQPLTECRECMQRYYWDNVSYYLKYEMEG